MPGNPLTDPNWAPDLANTIDGIVGGVRDKVTDKAVVAVRAVVFGVIIAISSLAVATLAVVVLLKLLQRVSRVVFRVDAPTSVWISYLLVAGIMVLAGALAMRMRHTKAAQAR
jgi:hypothetical protein